MEMTQYQKDVVRMWDSMREEYKGEPRCITVDCKVCPLYECCCRKDGNITFNVEKAIEIVNNWAKEHPFVTYEQKYEETFGVKPKNLFGDMLCPHFAGFVDVKCEKSIKGCAKCKEGFWGAEYKPPKADKEGVSNANSD